MKSVSPHSVLITALILMTVISIGLSFHWQFRPRVDAGAYNAIGWNLAQGFGYVEDVTKAGNPQVDEAIIRVGPGYQFFLAGVYRIFGHNVPLVWVLQAFLHALTAWGVYRIIGLLLPDTSKWPAVLGAVLFGFSPDLIFINSMLLSESLFLMLLVFAVYLTLLIFVGGNIASRNITTSQVVKLISTGMLWGLAILTRPTAILSAGAFLLFLGIRCDWRRALAVCLPIVLLVGAWSFYATQRYESFVLTTTAGGYDLWVGNHPGATGGFDKTPEIKAIRDANPSVLVDRIGKEKYIEFLVSHPFRFVELQVRKTAIYFSLIRPTGFWLDLQFFPIDRLILVSFSLLWTAGLLLAGVTGWILFVWQRKGELGPRVLAIFALLQPLAVIPIIVDTRYRYPLFPFLAIGAAYAFWVWLRGGEGAPKFVTALRWSSLFLMLATVYDAAYHAGDIIIKIKTIL